MLICPACSSALTASQACNACGWEVRYREGVAVLLPDADLRDEITRSYTENYDRIARDDLNGEVMEPRYIENLAANLCDAIDLPSGAQICDVGSGKGFLVRKLLARGAAGVAAVNISLPYLIRMVGHPGVSPVMANAEALPFAEHFDIVIATDILEHVLNVGSFLYSANRALRTRGRLYVRVPYKENLLGYSPHFGCPFRFVHLRTYDRPLLRQALEEAGFAVERLWKDGYVLGEARAFWQHGRLRQKLYRLFESRCRSDGRDPADLTLRGHWMARIFLRPTVIVAAARKAKNLVPQNGGGFRLVK
jgi:SAM-dependent methyltransferase